MSGILEGALAGAMKGMAGVGAAWMTEGFREAQAERDVEARSRLQKEQADLLEIRAKNVERFKVELAEELRQRNVGRYKEAVGQVSGLSDQFGAARQAYADPDAHYINDAGEKVMIDKGMVNSAIDKEESGAIARAMQDPKTAKAAAMTLGDFDSAKTLDPLTQAKAHNVPFGSTAVDLRDGKVLHDSTAELKGSIEQQKIDARNAAKGGKPVSNEKLQKEIHDLDKRANEVTKEIYDKRTHPYAEEGEDAKKAPDTAGANVLRQAIRQTGRAAMKNGQIVSDYEIAETMTAQIDKMDTLHRGLADKAASELFDEKGKPKNDKLAKEFGSAFGSANISTKSATDFKRSFRDSLMDVGTLREFTSNPDAYQKRMSELMARIFPDKGLIDAERKSAEDSMAFEVGERNRKAQQTGQSMVDGSTRYSNREVGGKIQY